MSMHDSITRAIRNTGKKPALIAYITAGFPDKETFRSQLLAVAAAVDAVEVGVPFTDPMADGTTIQRSSRRALEHGVSLRWILNELTEMNPRPQAPVLLMSYLNPLLAYGLDKLPQAAARAGVAGFIIPDLPFEECEDMRSALAEQGIALVQFVTPVSPDERMQQLTRASSGFVYAVTMTGTTGKNVEAPQEVLDYFARARKLSPLPVCAGFGIRSAEQIRKLAPYVDGVIVGSALVEVIERGEDPAAFLKALRN
jgi:tryptophan synthase alpha chain